MRSAVLCKDTFFFSRELGLRYEYALWAHMEQLVRRCQVLNELI